MDFDTYELVLAGPVWNQPDEQQPGVLVVQHVRVGPILRRYLRALRAP